MTVFWMSLGMGLLAGASGRPIPNVSPSRRNHFTPCCLLRSRGSDAHPPGQRCYSPGSAVISAPLTGHIVPPATRTARCRQRLHSGVRAATQEQRPTRHARSADITDNFGTKPPSRQARCRTSRAWRRLVSPTIGSRPLTTARYLRSRVLPLVAEHPEVSDFFTPGFSKGPPVFAEKLFFSITQSVVKSPSDWHTYCSCFAAHPGAGKLWVIF